MVDEQRYTELAELAGGFIHDLKNHLSTLRLNLNLLAEDFQEPQNQRERRAFNRIHRLQNECERLVDLSNDFLRFARVKDLELRPTRLSTVIEELVDFFSPTARLGGLNVTLYIPADLPLVMLDREMFKQALLNLLLNAQQAMPKGGELIFQAGREPSGIFLSVIDNGPGMPPEVVEKAFKPFFTTRKGGTGLGLATTRRIVEAHGGRLELQSEVGHGTKFTLRLPSAPASTLLPYTPTHPENLA